ncbi:hypothetical protein [Desulfogranum marinum]|uniref:hypothetical protein n=1 Tax=Desulfogranum marinum TaxID=453220 RepID=UPI001963F547|nr:hypothetical protein [Desulfogranum marinum]MBM9514260.1 hypothetical protein [Desulfogranum marinum]
MEFLTVQCVGYITYSDALIARIVQNEFLAFLLSLIGSPAHIQASSAVLFGGDACRVTQSDIDLDVQVTFTAGELRTYRNRKIGNTVNKVMVCPQLFTDVTQSAVVFGPNMSTVQERAFLRFDAATNVPLKREWQGWLWDEILQPEKLYSFGSDELQEAYLIQWPDETVVEERIVEGVKRNYLD